MAADAMNESRFRVAALVLMLALGGCGGGQEPAPATTPPLEGARIGGPFRLIDQNSRPFADSQLAGKWRIMYFGYTFCPDVCPVDMANITTGLKAFEKSDPAHAASVVPVFVTIDPERDTPGVLKQYAANFHPRTIGLTGDPKTITAVAKDFAIVAQRREGATPGAYLMDHSRLAYLMDPAGKPIALVPADESGEAVAKTLAQWVK